jgi:hypothetical protein
MAGSHVRQLQAVHQRILDDANLRIGSVPDAYQIDAILGLPIFRSLGVVTFMHESLRAGDAADQHILGARMYMRGLTPASECVVDGQPLLFTFETGGRVPICPSDIWSYSASAPDPGRSALWGAVARAAR